MGVFGQMCGFYKEMGEERSEVLDHHAAKMFKSRRRKLLNFAQLIWSGESGVILSERGSDRVLSVFLNCFFHQYMYNLSSLQESSSSQVWRID